MCVCYVTFDSYLAGQALETGRRLKNTINISLANLISLFDMPKKDFEKKIVTKKSWSSRS